MGQPNLPRQQRSGRLHNILYKHGNMFETHA